MSSFRRPFTVRRAAAGAYNDAGFFEVSAEPSTFTIQASLQPITGSEIKLLPEDRREEELCKIYTDTALIGSLKGNTGNCDIVEINGSDYEVVKTLPWQNGVINHNKIILSKRTTNDTVPPIEELP